MTTLPEEAVKAAKDVLYYANPNDVERALTAAAPHLEAVRVTGDDLVERVARAWASIDGRSDLFDECKFSKFMEDQNGTYEGYMAEARELIKRAALEPSAAREQALHEAARNLINELSGETGELIDRMAAAIRDWGSHYDDGPWETLPEDRKAGWRGDAERALAAVKEYLTTRALSSQDHVADAAHPSGGDRHGE